MGRWQRKEKNWIVKVIDWGFKEIWPLLLVYLFVQIVFQLVSIYLIGWPTWSEAGLNTLAQPLKISGIVNGILTLILVILGLSVAAKRLLQFNQQLKQQNKQINIQLESMKQQRFYDAVKLLGDDKEYLQLGALNVIRQICTKKDTPFLIETQLILREFLGKNTNTVNEHIKLIEVVDNISGIAATAFMTLIDIIYAHKDLRENQDDREIFQNLNFYRLNVEQHLNLHSIEFSNCELRFSDFTNTVMTNVSFKGGRVSIAEASYTHILARLINVEFVGAKFENCDFGNADISGANFSNCSGLAKTNLQFCHYSTTNPPKNLPNDIILKYPYVNETPSRASTEEEREAFVRDNERFTKTEGTEDEKLGPLITKPREWRVKSLSH